MPYLNKESLMKSIKNPTACPLCKKNKDNLILVHQKLRYSFPAAIYKCMKCEYVFLFPRMNEEEVNNFYKNEYTEQYQTPVLPIRFDMDRPEALTRLNRVLLYGKGASSLLEIGAGSGAFLFAAMARACFKKVVGVEPNKEAYLYIKKKNISVYESLDEVEYKKFDLIVLFHVLEHFLDPVSFLRKLKS